MVVQQHHGCIAACAHALAFHQREFAVRGGFAVVDAELLFQVFARIHAAAQGAGKVGADGEFVFAHGFEVVHIVERGDFIRRNGRNADILRHIFDGFGRKVAKLGLSDTQRAHNGAAALVGGIFGQFCVDLLQRLCG